MKWAVRGSCGWLAGSTRLLMGLARAVYQARPPPDLRTASCKVAARRADKLSQRNEACAGCLASLPFPTTFARRGRGGGGHSNAWPNTRLWSSAKARGDSTTS
jgi:hypothetical protein